MFMEKKCLTKIIPESKGFRKSVQLDAKMAIQLMMLFSSQKHTGTHFIMECGFINQTVYYLLAMDSDLDLKKLIYARYYAHHHHNLIIHHGNRQQKRFERQENAYYSQHISTKLNITTKRLRAFAINWKNIIISCKQQPLERKLKKSLLKS